MNIIDTNGISYILENSIIPQDDYYLVPDVSEEIEMTQLIHGRRIPPNIIEMGQSAHFDEVLYLDHYKKALNKYSGRSFYNMTGFGDISIIATLATLMDVFDQQKNAQLFDPTEQVVVYTNDARLTAKITGGFSGRDIVVRPIVDIN